MTSGNVTESETVEAVERQQGFEAAEQAVLDVE